MLAHQWDVGSLIGKFLLHPPLQEKGRFLLLAGVCALLQVLWGERNNIDFGVERDPPSEVSYFCNYSLGNILLSQSPFKRAWFLYALLLSFFSMKVVASVKKIGFLRISISEVPVVCVPLTNPFKWTKLCLNMKIRTVPVPDA